MGYQNLEEDYTRDGAYKFCNLFVITDRTIGHRTSLDLDMVVELVV